MRIWNRLRGMRGVEIVLPLVLLAVVLLVLLREQKGGQQGTLMEQRLAETLSWIDGAGEVRTVIYDAGENEIEGVLIVAEGADDLRIRLEIGEAVHRVLGVELERIDVLEMKGE